MHNTRGKSKKRAEEKEIEEEGGQEQEIELVTDSEICLLYTSRCV